MDIKKPELPVLIGQSGPLNGLKWQISESILIGRDQGCDIVIQDRQVSRFHARLTIEPSGVILEDLGSKNGTFCEGRMIAEPTFIQDGNLLQIALVQSFVYLSSDATLPVGLAPGISQPRRGKLYLDERSRRVWVGDDEIIPPLSAQQYRLLLSLYNAPGQVVKRQEIILATWGEEEALGVSEQALDALVRRLRDRLAQTDPVHNYLVTVRGHGLRLENPPFKAEN
ncbi:MAG: FHA domain-containing protein [Anaerolineae bacterium]|nr:FHA domain-containing protein [Anaerolineae bacterium]